MTEKVLKTKIALLYKTYEQWSAIATSYVPLKGEVCFCEVPQGTGAVQQEPAILFKVGDGTKNFANLPWASALAADIYSWAKKANLEFGDLNAEFLAKLDERIAEKSENVEYQIADAGNGIWKLQKRQIGATEWIDVSSVDVASYVNPLLAKKVEKEIVGTNGKALIFNEADGGGAKFEANSGVESFVGVNDGTNGIAAQIYADKLVDGKWQGAKLDVTNNGIYYTVGNKSAAERIDPDNEIVVWSDIKNIPGGMRFIGVGELAAGQELEAAIKATYEANGYAYPGDRKVGDIVILADGSEYKEFIYTSAEGWVELGDSSLYATKVELAAEASARSSADATLQENIDAEEAGRIAADNALQSLINGKADLPGECPPWLNPTGQTPYPWFMASLDVESQGLGPDAEGNLKANVGAYNFNSKQYYKWEKNIPFAATTTKAGLLTAADKVKVDKSLQEDDTLILNCNL